MKGLTETLRQFELHTECGITVFTWNAANNTWSVDLGCYSAPAKVLAEKFRKTADQVEELAEFLKPPKDSLL